VVDRGSERSSGLGSLRGGGDRFFGLHGGDLLLGFVFQDNGSDLVWNRRWIGFRSVAGQFPCSLSRPFWPAATHGVGNRLQRAPKIAGPVVQGVRYLGAGGFQPGEMIRGPSDSLSPDGFHFFQDLI